MLNGWKSELVTRLVASTSVLWSLFGSTRHIVTLLRSQRWRWSRWSNHEDFQSLDISKVLLVSVQLGSHLVLSVHGRLSCEFFFPKIRRKGPFSNHMSSLTITTWFQFSLTCLPWQVWDKFGWQLERSSLAKEAACHDSPENWSSGAFEIVREFERSKYFPECCCYVT